MKKRIIAAALLATVASFSTLAAEQVSKQEISHFKLVKVRHHKCVPEWRTDFLTL